MPSLLMHTPHSVPSSCTQCQPVLLASTSDKKYRFGVPFKVLTKQVGLYRIGTTLAYLLSKSDCLFSFFASQVWFVDGTVKCFRGAHIPLALLALSALVFCIAIILFFVVTSLWPQLLQVRTVDQCESSPNCKRSEDSQ